MPIAISSISPPTPAMIFKLRSHAAVFIKLPVTNQPNQAPAPLTTPLDPNFPTTPFCSPNCFSISSSPFLNSSRIINTCLTVTTSKNLLPAAPLLPKFSNSSSASCANLSRACSNAIAGFVPEGKIDCEGDEADGWKFACVDCWDCERVGPYAEAEELNVEELDIVGEGCTGPSCERRAL